MSLEVLLFALLAALTVGALALVAVTCQRLTGKVSVDLQLGTDTHSVSLRERDIARALASELRARLESVTRASQGPQESVTRDATPSVTVTPVRTVPLNKEAKVTGYTESGETFPVPQDYPSTKVET